MGNESLGINNTSSGYPAAGLESSGAASAQQTSSPKTADSKVASNPECAVCLTEIRQSDKSISPGCSHLYHLHCAARSFIQPPNGMRCPCCRGDVDLLSKVKVYGSMVEAQPNEAAFRSGYGVSLIKSGGDKQKGFDSLKKAVELNQFAPVYWHNMIALWPDDVETIDLRLASASSEDSKSYTLTKSSAYQFYQRIKINKGN